MTSPLHHNASHESAALHVTGAAVYVDDLPPPHGMLIAWPVTSPHAHARIVAYDASQARTMPGIHAVLFASDIPGINDGSPYSHDEEVLAAHTVLHVGHRVALVVGENEATCRAAAKHVQITYEPRTPILTLRDAIAHNHFIAEPQRIARDADNIDAILRASAWHITGEVDTPGQDHFYLETNVAQATPLEDGCIAVMSSTQHPSEVQAKVAEFLGMGRHRISVTCPRMGGGFGGKETQAAQVAQLAALAAWHTRRPVRLRLNREQDMAQTGKRHPWHSHYEAGFDADGRFTALKVNTYSDGGFSTDLSKAIMQRCLFHLDNCYFIPHALFEGRICHTHLPSNTAFRGFGGPQGVAVVEMVLNHAAEVMQRDPAQLRQINFYNNADETPYGQAISHTRMPAIWNELMRTSNYDARRTQIDAFNRTSQFIKRGIAFAPVKFGISFTTSMLNQAGALVLIYQDGTVQLNHGGTEMGQGLHSKMLAICAHALGVRKDDIRVMPTNTEKIPNTSATAASSGSDLNGQAVKDACDTLRARLAPVACTLLQKRFVATFPPGTHRSAQDVVFDHSTVYFADHPNQTVPFADVTHAAYVQRVCLFATGYYFTPHLHFDLTTGRGHPFHYFAYGGAVVEVEVNGLTGEHRMQRVDVLHDVGNALIPSIDKGQVEGGFIQGAGWLTYEELVWHKEGRLLTAGASTYKIPAIGEAPLDFRVALLQHAPAEGVIYGSKAVGEPPLMLGIGVVSALRHAVAAFAPQHPSAVVPTPLTMPCTPEAVLRAIHQQQHRDDLCSNTRDPHSKDPS